MACVWLSKKQVHEKGLASTFLWSSFVLRGHRKIHQESGFQFEENIRRLRDDDLSKLRSQEKVIEAA